MEKRWIQLGIVGKAHGLNGAFFVSQRDEEIPPELKSLRIGPTADQSKSFTIKSSRWQSDRPVLLCEEVSSREAAEAICHQRIWADREAMEIDEDEEYFWSDVIGKKIQDRDGVFFGTIRELVNYGASDIVVVENDQSMMAEIPFVDFYFDMDFDPEDPELKLTVTADVFEDIWTKK